MEAQPRPADGAPDAIHTGQETVLVVEDEPSVRALAVEALRQRGYTVLEAENGEHALGVAAAYDGPIHMLVTDVVMPRLGGRELWRRLTAHRSGLRVLFVSGYVEEQAFFLEVERGSAVFLRKPFMPQALTAKVRELLDTGMASPAAPA
jgi:DNA-binding response OmpR family regulator